MASARAGWHAPRFAPVPRAQLGRAGGRRDVPPKVFPATAFHTRVTAQRLLKYSTKNLVWVSQSEKYFLK